MLDHFEILSLPKQASLNEDELHRAYAARSRVVHPDHGGSEGEAALLNAAYETLRAPERRLKHLLEVAGPENAKVWRTIPLDEELMSLFIALGKALEVSARFLEKKSKSQSALARALLSNEEMTLREALEELGFELERRRVALEQDLPRLDKSLQHAGEEDWKQLAIIQAKFAYLSKWQTQVRERLLTLM